MAYQDDLTALTTDGYIAEGGDGTTGEAIATATGTQALGSSSGVAFSSVRDIGIGGGLYMNVVFTGVPASGNGNLDVVLRGKDGGVPSVSDPVVAQMSVARSDLDDGGNRKFAVPLTQGSGQFTHYRAFLVKSTTMGAGGKVQAGLSDRPIGIQIYYPDAVN